MFKFSAEKLGKASLWACLVGCIATTASELWMKIRHDKREKELYAKLQIKADTVPVLTLASMADKEEA